MTHLGALLRSYREDRGLSQEALAERAGAGLSVNTISNIERERTRPYRHTVEALCDALELDDTERHRVLEAGGHIGRPVLPAAKHTAAQIPLEASMVDWLPATKFSPPIARPDLIVRPRLLDSLRTGIEWHRLLLISAPAGSGKTTLVATGLRDLGTRFSWMAVDEDDDDVVRFLALLITGVRRLVPDGASRARQLLDGLPHPAAHVRQILGALINDLTASPEPAVLVLDDLHRVTAPAIVEAIDYLVERLPPGYRLVIATRHDPPIALARLRARGELAEIRFPELRFTPDETACFLRERHALTLSDEDLSLLDERTEGWAAGIRLLVTALARLSGRQNREAFLANLAGIDRQMFTFLAEEVLRHESPTMQAFLLETSILRHLTPSLCRAVTGRDDAAVLLDDLERRNLFVTAVDEPGEPTFRYHDLFAGFLRQQLERETPGRVIELHRRAARADPAPAEAIGHLLAARLWEDAAQRIVEVGDELLRSGLLDTLRRWLAAVPGTVIDTHPRLLYLQGRLLWRQGETAEARSVLERATGDLADIDARMEEGESTAMLATIALMQGDDDRARRLVEQALSLPIRPPTRVQLFLERARARLWRGERGAAADLDAALTASRQSADRETVAALITYLHPIFAGLPGGLERIEQACRLAESILPTDEGPVRITLDEQWVLVHLRRGEFDACLDAGRRALASRERYGSVNPVMDLWTVWSLAVVDAARGQYRDAERYCDLLFALAGPGEAQRAPALYTWGWMCWLQGRSHEAREAYRELCSLKPLLPVTPILQTMLQGLLLLAEGNYPAAEQMLRDAVGSVRALPASADLHGNPALLLAHLHLVAGHPRQALEDLTPVLKAAARDDTPGLIAKEGAPMIPLMRLAIAGAVEPDVASRVLRVLGVPEEGKSVRVPGTGEALSPREVELLRLVASGASNRQIAKQLVIGDQTVKTHVSHILRKLDASSRTEAAARARELRLL